jgi:tRNA threonylcarbamoyladenosine biosynthesis protein TsaE
LLYLAIHMPEITLYLPDLLATQNCGEQIGRQIALPAQIALNGELGAGKTSLSQGIAKGFGVREPVTSPTFALMHEYIGARGSLFHLDLYRLGSLDEVLDLGLEERILTECSLILVEWQNKFPNWLADLKTVEIELSHEPPGRKALIRMPAQPIFALEALQVWQS